MYSLRPLWFNHIFKPLHCTTYDYSYVTDTDRVGTTDYPITMSATRSYESDRNAVDYVQNDVSDSTVSRYGYIYWALCISMLFVW